MAFSESIKDEAFKRSGGMCECTRTSHLNHTGRCSKILTRYGTEYYHVVSQDAGGTEDLSNCEVLCTICHRQIRSNGGY